ncbi:MAG: VPLPA-CTERM-specific exosortase XrtD [Acidobacteria bacterium]|nr:VPLPA-CTERM-specific exosortase XrtD [Acidobacteriota bacterium]
MSTRIRAAVAAALIVLGFAVLYWHVIARLVHDWATDDNYSHGFLIVPIALYLAWERRDRLAAAGRRPSGLGLIVVLLSVGVLAAGVLGSELFLTRVSILGVIAGLVLFRGGWKRLAVLAFPIAFLLLMIPIPAIIFNQIAFPLQLLASRFGELTLTAAGIPVLREGNVITLATTSLEVAEACSGIRSLISLLTLAIVYGYLIDQRPWARVVLALASVPVAIVANGVRVAGTGIAAHYYGAQAAMGFFHTFSGWLVFLVAFILLFVVQRVIVLIAPARAGTSRLRPSGFGAQGGPGSRERAVGSERPQLPNPDSRILNPDMIRVLVVSACLIAGAVLIASASKSEVVPPRESFATFPIQIGTWRGEPAPRFDQQVLTVLGVDEYISRVYYRPDGRGVGLYVGYYQSQRQGDTMHSPLNCLPGAGWEPMRKVRPTLEVPIEATPSPGNTGVGTRAITINRIVIQKGLERQVVMYWYQSHGRVIASEYWGKIYTVVDSIRLRRTDSAMIRLISPVTGTDPAGEAAAEQAVTEFAREMFPLLSRYLPE